MTTFKPILFSTPMVLALLNGTKTQTRRTKGLEKINESPDEWSVEKIKSFFAKIDNENDFQIKIIKPAYEVGDILWVREKFRVMINCETKEFSSFEYYAGEQEFYEYLEKQGKKVKWKPSIFMPKPACRLFLKVKAIRVERLNTISNKDAIAEGINSEKYALDNKISIYENYLPGKDFYDFGDYSWNFGKENHSAPVASFCSLWESINGDGSWNSNPFVWVIEFERIEKPNNFI